MELSSLARMILVTFFAAALSACGGGSSGSKPISANETPPANTGSSSFDFSSSADTASSIKTGADSDDIASSAGFFSSSARPLPVSSAATGAASVASTTPAASSTAPLSSAVGNSSAVGISSAKTIASSSTILSSTPVSSRASAASSMATSSVKSSANSSINSSANSLAKSSVKSSSASSLSRSSVGLTASSSVISSLSSLSASSSSSEVIFVEPSVKIIFPSANVTSDGTSVLVRGTAASHLGKVVSVHVNGFFAATTDDFANWQVRVPLRAGENRLKVSVSDSAGMMALEAEEVIVTTPVLLKDPRAFVLDTIRNRMLVVDAALNAVVEIDLATGVRKVFVDMHGFDKGKGLVDPTAISIDYSRGYALMMDQGRDSIIAVDLISGAQSIFSGPSAIHFSAVKSMVVDQLHNRILVLDSVGDAVIAVDLFNGERTRFAQVPASPQGISLDLANNRALVVGYMTESVTAVNLDNGNISELTSNAMNSDDINFRRPLEIAVDADRSRALVADSYNFAGAIVAVDLATGRRSLVSAHDAGSVTFSEPLDLVIDKAHGRALLLDQELKELIAIDLNTGARSILRGQGESEIVRPFLKDPKAVAFDMPRNRALVLDHILGGLVAVDLTSGERSMFAITAASEDAGKIYNPLGGMVIDAARNRALVVDGVSHGVIAVDLNNGTRSVLSHGVSENGEIIFSPYSITLDPQRNRALVLDVVAATGGGVEGAVVAVDLNNGSRTTLSRNDAPGGSFESNFTWAHDITLDPMRQRALVVDSATRTVLAVDLLSGQREVLFSQANAAWQGSSSLVLANPYGITLDPVRNRALVADKGLPALVAVDLTSGFLSMVSGSQSSDSANQFRYPIFTAMDPVYNRALVVDGDLRAIVEVDLITGERVLLAR